MYTRPTPKPKLTWVRPVIVTLLCIGFVVGYFFLFGTFSAQHEPTAVAFDNQNHLYVADSDLGQIQKFDLTGEQVGSIGSRGKADGQFRRGQSPSALAVDHEGNIYAASKESNYIQKFDSQGHFLAKLNIERQPQQLLTDSHGNLVVLFKDKPFVGWYDKNGLQLTSWDWPADNTPPIDDYSRFAIDSKDNLYIKADSSIYKYDAQNHLLNHWPLKDDTSYGGIAADEQGQVYVTNYQTIYKYDSQGQFLTSWKEPTKPVYSIKTLGISPGGSLYVAGYKNQSQGVVQDFDNNLHPQLSWTQGFPFWVSMVFIYNSWLLAVIAVFVVRWVWRGKLEITSTDTEPLPAWVETGKANPKLLYDHLDLQNLGKSQRQSNNGLVEFTFYCLYFIAAIAIVVIGIAEMTGIAFGDGPSFDAPVLIASGVIVVCGLLMWRLGLDKIRKNRAKKLEQQALIRQVQGTFPATTRSVFIQQAGSAWRNPNWSSFWFYPVFYTPMTLMILSTSNIGGEGSWFDGWPSWVVEIILVTGLVGAGLVGIWLLNRLQTEKPGKVRLNRAEMLDLQGWAWLWLFGFVALTAVLDGLVISLFDSGDPIFSQAYNWIFIFAIVRYAFLIFGFFYLPQRWLNAPYEAGNYEAARRRIVYWRRWSKTLNARLRHVEILRRAGRLNEAEYVLQETLAKPNFQTPEGLAKTLAALGLVRLDQERYAEAMFVLENSLLLNSSNSVNSNNLAEVYLWLNHRPDRALTLSNRILPSSTITGKSVAIADRLINLAWAQAQLGRWPEAEANLAEAFKKAPPRNKPFQASLLLRTGLVLQLKGDYQAAMENYQQAVACDPIGYNGQRATEYLAYNQAALPGT